MIKEVVIRALFKQPLPRREFRKFIEDELSNRLDATVIYNFDESDVWDDIAHTSVDNVHVVISEIDDFDTIEILNGLDVKYFSIRLKGKVVSVCRVLSGHPTVCEHIMVDCELISVVEEEEV